ncbi:MAG: DUF488 domain-containing protein [Candidatus Korobacteraceae bacterium]
MTIALKRVYEDPSPRDGARVLVDRLWPRGLTKADAALDAWLRDLAPSDELRKWYHAHPLQWSKFRERYLKELSNDAAHDALQKLYALKERRRRVTLLYASRNEEHNNAVVLRQLVEGDRKPPTGTGPIRAVAAKRARAARRR